MQLMKYEDLLENVGNLNKRVFALERKLAAKRKLSYRRDLREREYVSRTSLDYQAVLLLRLMRGENYASRLAVELRFRRETVSSLLNDFYELGYVDKRRIGVRVNYFLTDSGMVLCRCLKESITSVSKDGGCIS